MKTKNAFAFRNFDETKILSRNFFKDLISNLKIAATKYERAIFDMVDPAKSEFFGEKEMTSHEIVDELCCFDETVETVEDYEENFQKLKKIQSAVEEYTRKILRHMRRLEIADEEITTELLKTPSNDIEKIKRLKNCHDRARILWEKYSNIGKSIENLSLIASENAAIVDADIVREHRKNFAARLKCARKSARLTQKELAEASGISLNTLINYENARREPNLTTIQRLIHILGISADKLFETT